MNKKIFLPLLLAAAVCLPSHGQSTGENEGRFRQDYLPVSPTTAALMRRVQCPVNYSTGRIDLSIPLYEIRTRDFTLPLTLKYAGGGVKVDDTDDLAGLGWTLDFGPTMGRSIQGMPDENVYLTYNPDFGSQESSYLDKLANGTMDELPDVFYYSTLDRQGCFVLKRPETSAQSRTYTPLMIPLNETRIACNGSAVSGFTLTDGSGNSYLFTEKEYTDSNKLTGWKLKTLTSPRGDRMDFSYTECDIQHLSSYDYYAAEDQPEGGLDLSRSGYWQGCDGKLTFFATNGYELRGDSLWGDFIDTHSNLTYTHRQGSVVSALFPSEITYEGGRVTFAYEGNRLTGMRVYEGNTELQRITFTYHKMRVGTRSLLTKVAFTDPSSGKTRTYELDYWNRTDEYDPYTKAVDRHGYYNGHEENTDRVERRLVEFGKPSDGNHSTYYGYIGGADRSPVPDYARYYSIYSIRYPDGGREQYDYELNLYDGYDVQGNPTVLYAGGLRISRIECRDADGTLKNVRSFSYDTENATVPSVQDEEETQKIYIAHNHTDYFRYRLYPSTPVADSGVATGTPILYREVTETIDGETESGATRTYTYEQDFSYPYISSGMVHDNILAFRKGILRSVADTNPATGDTLKLEEYTNATLTWGSAGEEKGREARQVNILVPADESLATESFRHFATYHYTIRTANEHPVVKEEKVTDFYDGGSTVQTTERTFGTTQDDVRTGLPIKEAVHGADGNARTMYYSYPYHVTEAAARTMVAANDLKRPWVITKEYDSATQVPVQDWRTDFTYKTLSGVGSAVLSAAASGGHEGSALTDESYTAHDAQGNICEIRRRDGSLTTVLYGYHYRHPVAVIEGAAYSDVIAALGISYTALQDLTGTTLRNRLLGLRTAFPAPCRVTVYDYAPTRGPVYRNDPNGNVTTWSYDGFGRMTEARDAEGAVMQYNEYGEY